VKAPEALPDEFGQTVGLALSGIVKRFGEVQAVDDVSLEIHAGEFITLLGPSGSGKTTTLMIIAGFEMPDEGEVRLGDRVVTDLPPYRRNLGMVYQNYALFPHMTVAGNIAFPLDMRRTSRVDTRRRVDEMLELVRLPGYGDRYPRQLSGGQQQRVALARALVFRPPVLLMDEPLGALDKKLRVEMQSEIKRIQQDLGITTVYVTHDQEEALTMSDRIAVMNRGRIEQVGRPEELYERPANRFVADFLGDTNFLTGRVAELGASDAAVRTPSGMSLRVNREAVLRMESAVVLAIRPERVRVIPRGTAEAHGYPGVVAEAIYVGGQRRYVLVLDGGDRLVAVEPNLGERILARGEKIEAIWRPEDLRVIAAEGVTP
jgi:putative spermidine/putrescine transport system ATP-binding protein